MSDSGSGKGGLRAAFLFLLLFAFAVLSSGEYYPYALGLLRAAVFFAAGVRAWSRGRDIPDAPGYAFAVAGFSFLALGHSLSSVYVWASLQHALNIALAAALLAWAVMLFGDGESPPAKKMLLPAVAGLAVLEFAVAAHQRAFLGTPRPYGTFSNPMFLSEFLAAGALLCVSRFLAVKSGPGAGRFAWGAMALFLLAGALSLTSSRGVVVGLVPAFAVLALSHFGVSRGGKVLALAFLPLLAVLGWQSVSRFASPDVYHHGRWVFWRAALRIFAEHPFGVGLGGYKYFWFQAQEPFPQAFRHFAKYAVTPHNEYLEVLAGLGFVGFAAFCAVLLLPLGFAARGMKEVPAENRWLAEGAAAALVLSGTNAAFNFNLHEFGIVFMDVLMLGVVLASLPRSALGRRVPLSPALRKGASVLLILLGVVSAASLGGVAFVGWGDRSVRAGDDAGAEKAFRIASRLDPLRASIPDALSALYHRRFLDAGPAGTPAAMPLLNASMEWQERARSLCPMEQRYSYRLADLHLERHRLEGGREDLEAAIRLTGEILRINPYGVEAFWNLALAQQAGGQAGEAVATLRRAVSLEPNFCRGYAKLSELTVGTDDAQSLVWSARAAECRESAKGRPLEENERWLVEEPRTASRR